MSIFGKVGRSLGSIQHIYRKDYYNKVPVD